MKTRLFFSPDAAAPAGGASPAATPAPAPNSPLSAANSPTGMDIPTAPSKTQAPAVIVQEKPIMQKGIVDVKKALGLDKKPSQLVTETAQQIRDRNQRGQFIPTPKIKSKAEKVEPAAEEAAATPATETPKPEAAAAAEPVAATPAPAAKIKVGEKEMTPEEVLAHIAALEAKIKPKEEAPAAPAKPAKEPEPELNPQQRAAREKQLDDEFIAKTLESFPGAIDQASFDKMIADGDVAGFNRLRVQDMLAQRKWVEQALNPILKDLFEFRDKANGAVQMHEQVAQYQAEAQFFEKHQDLKPHIATVRNVRKVLAEKYPTEWAGMSPEERDTETANAVRGLPIAQPVSAAPAPAATPVAPPKPKPQPKPATGQLSNGGNGGGKPIDITSPQYLLQRGKV